MEVFASATPFATHIFPLRHMASFGDISEMEVVDLARVLRTLLAKIYVGLENPDLNFTVHFHWYVSVIPRLTRVAGLSWGLGCSLTRFCRRPQPSSCGRSRWRRWRERRWGSRQFGEGRRRPFVACGVFLLLYEARRGSFGSEILLNNLNQRLRRDARWRYVLLLRDEATRYNYGLWVS
jgi:hypothetical protein